MLDRLPPKAMKTGTLYMKIITFAITEEEERQLREGVIGNVEANERGEICLEWHAATEEPGAPFMRRHVLVGRIVAAFLAFAMLAATTFAGTFRVTYTAAGLVQRVTVQAATPYEARRTVQHMFGGYVTGVQQVAR